eukprot:snap_masked-scaffold_3-processed-gene-1.45-mRNA-1 protein AED:1.00 eAED:1.00 QI:0/0/0/0/1/1/2/0/64
MDYLMDDVVVKGVDNDRQALGFLGGYKLSIFLYFQHSSFGNITPKSHLRQVGTKPPFPQAINLL